MRHTVTCKYCGNQQTYVAYGGGAVLPENVDKCSGCGKPLDVPRDHSGAALPQDAPSGESSEGLGH
jgi:hypothetical protein